jgi:uncharacterized membrane protein
MLSSNQKSALKSLAVILTLAVLTRFIDLGYKTFWFDEGTAVFVARGLIQEYFHPPGYFAIVRLVTGLFGESEYAYRLTAALFGWLTVLFVYFTAQQIFRTSGNRFSLAALAGLLAAVSPYMISVSQENRTYSLLAFVAISSTFFLLKALEEDARRAWRWWLAYTVVLTCGAYCHIFAFTLLLSGNCYFLGLKLFRKHRVHYLRYLLVQAITFLLYLPQLITTINQVSVRGYTLIQNIHSLGLKYYLIGLCRTLYRYAAGVLFDAPGSRFFDTLQRDPFTAGMGLAGNLLVGLAMVLTVWGLVRFYKNRENSDLLIFFAAFGAVPLVASLTIDDALPRQLSHVAPYFVLALSAGIGALGDRFRRSAIVLILLGSLALYIPYSLSDTFTFSTARWKHISEYLNDHVGEEELVYVNAGTREGYYTLKYYGCRCELKFPGRKHMAEGMAVRYYRDKTGQIHLQTDSELAEAFFLEYDYARIWFINYEYSRTDLVMIMNAQRVQGDFGAGVEVVVVDNPFISP